MMAWIWHVWINAMVFLPMAQAPHKADATELLYCLPSKFDPWVYILFLDKGDFAGMPKKTFPRKQAFVHRKQVPRFSQGQPKGYYQMKELDRTTEAFARMNVVWKVEKAARAEFNMPTCGNICFGANSFTSVATHGDEYNWICIIIICVSLWLGKQCCAEKDSLCGRVMIAWIWHVWINAMCSFLRHKLLTRLTQQNCFIVYRLNWSITGFVLVCKGIGSVTQQVPCNWCNPIPPVGNWAVT